MKKLLIIGAGEAGKMLLHEITSHPEASKKYEICGFLDDDPDKKSIEGIPVLGKIEQAKDVISKNSINEVIIAIPSAGRESIHRILNLLSGVTVDIKIVPGIYEIITGNISLNQIRSIEPSDILGREEVGFDIDKISPFYRNKVAFVTGAGGSIGSEIVNQLLSLPVKKIVAFGHGENSIHTLIHKVGKDPRFIYVIGDIRDSAKLNHEMLRFKPQIVFHAAAHKHVGLMENYPDEAVKSNIIGSYISAKASINCGVRHFVLISTDKAVNPTSIMGATKRIAEKIVLSMNKFQNKTIFYVTRFGNVLGSRGSVVPIFKSQIERGGPVTVTHPEISRFFMSIREAARLVIKSVTLSNGKIFILDMGKAVKILDLAKYMIRLYGYTEKEIPIIFTGLRPGEKMHEEVLTKKENLKKSIFEKLFVSEEAEESLSEKEIENLIKEFSLVAETFNKNEIIKLLKKYIPEYRKSKNAE